MWCRCEAGRVWREVLLGWRRQEESEVVKKGDEMNTEGFLIRVSASVKLLPFYDTKNNQAV